MDTVLKVDLPYVNGFVDRHGRPRFYLRKDGKCLPIKVPQANSEAFRAEYEKLLKQLAHMPDPKAKVEKPKTLAWLGSEYISSTASQTSREVSAAGRLVTARASKERLGEGDGQTLS